MSKLLWSLAGALSLVAATPAVAGDSDPFACDYCEQFPYSPFRVQIEGGRTITQGGMGQYLDNGMNVGLGFTWQPTAKWPLAVRADGMYQSFDARPLLLSQAAARFGTKVDEGSVKMWGGDIDAELDVKVSSGTRLYFLAGGGWYDQQSRFWQQDIRVSRYTTGMHFAKNGGIGVEFGNGGSVFFFTDVRYMRFRVRGEDLDFIPIRFGLRF